MNIRVYESPAADKLNSIGIDSIAAQIQQGDTFGEIADKAGVGLTTLHRWLEDKHADISARARQESAEAWLDRGLKALEAAKFKSGDLCPNAAKAIAQECARRAAIRNAKYRDKPDTTLTVELSPLAAFLKSIQDEGSSLPLNSGNTYDMQGDDDD